MVGFSTRSSTKTEGVTSHSLSRTVLREEIREIWSSVATLYVSKENLDCFVFLDEDRLDLHATRERVP